MALAAAPAPDQRPSSSSNPGAGAAGLSVNLSSNNPFRNRAASPSANTSNAPQSRQPPPPQNTSAMSKNPFLDASEVKSETNGNSAASTADIFKDLALLDKPTSNGAPPNRNGPPPRAGTLPPPGHRPMGSGDRRGPPRPSGGPDSPSKKDQRTRPRGMSESSAMDEMDRERRDARRERGDRTESEERRRRERRKEREERHRREKEKIRNGGSSGAKLKKPTGLDIIDKLDVTGIYGQGLFHHDGPFDACNPHRNARKDRKAPMQAFPEGSANMALGGAGPLRSRIDLDKFHGRGEEGFTDYAVTRKPDTAIMNPTDRVEQVHGDETHGLGTSTFLEGAPASRTAMQRRESEEQGSSDLNGLNGGGLTRKKSLAQRFRGMSATRPRPNGFRSPEARYQDTIDTFDSSPPNNKAVSAGGPLRARYNKENEVNPFDNEYDTAFDKKGTQIKIAETEKSSTGRPRAPSSPKGMGLVRSVTTDSSAARAVNNEEDRPTPGGGGFLNRMRSLKGPRRVRPDRRDT